MTLVNPWQPFVDLYFEFVRKGLESQFNGTRKAGRMRDLLTVEKAAPMLRRDGSRVQAYCRTGRLRAELVLSDGRWRWLIDRASVNTLKAEFRRNGNW